MTSPFEDQRPIFAILDPQSAWGAFLAARIKGDRGTAQTKNDQIAVRHMNDLEALDSCLFDNKNPVGILLADDFAKLSQLTSFVKRHAGRRGTFLVVASHQTHDEIGWLLRECGAHLVIRNIQDVMALVGPLQRFFECAASGRYAEPRIRVARHRPANPDKRKINEN